MLPSKENCLNSELSSLNKDHTYILVILKFSTGTLYIVIKVNFVTIYTRFLVSGQILCCSKTLTSHCGLVLLERQGSHWPR